MDYKNLKIWQKSMALTTEVYKITARFPRDEKFGLISQIQRSAVSVPSNIAEVNERKSTKHFISFLKISLGSISELETQLIISKALFYIDKDTFEIVQNKIKEIQKMLVTTIKTLNEKVV